MKKIFLFVVLVALMAGVLIRYTSPKNKVDAKQQSTFWEIQAIDTTKYSRDLAREKANDPEFDAVIEQQISNIAAAGATHVAIGSPYDEKYRAYLTRWVTIARKHNLKVWFRGNWAGWEGWFDKPKISREDHLRMTEDFILGNADLFEDGDIFSACTECENGGPGDPRAGDLEGYRKFLIDEYSVTKRAFLQISRGVKSNYVPMNGDVAKLVMDKETTKQLGGVVVIDHYVDQPKQIAADIKSLSESSGGKIMLGEFGAPIEDIHGKFTDDQQADWINSVLGGLYSMPELIGVNYWGAVGGSTQLWRADGSARPAVGILTSYYKPAILSGEVVNDLGQPVLATLESKLAKISTSTNGLFAIPYHDQSELNFSVSSRGYKTVQLVNPSDTKNVKVVLEKEHKNAWYRLRESFQ